MSCKIIFLGIETVLFSIRYGNSFATEPIIRQFDNVLLVKQKIPQANYSAGNGKFGLSRQHLLDHAQIIEQLTRTKLEIFGEKWSFFDVCHKMKLPKLSGEFSDLVVDLAREITPCTIVSPLDCFWEGARLHGPVPELDVSDISPFLQTLPRSGRVSWKNLNPKAIMREVEAFGIFKIDKSVHNLFINQFGSGFQERACLNPFRADCPSTAPNSLYKCRKKDKIYKPSCKMTQLQLDDMARHDRPHYFQLMDQHDHMDISKQMDHGCPAGPQPRMRRFDGVGLPGMSRDTEHNIVAVDGLETAMILTDPQDLYRRVQKKGETSVSIQNLRDGGYFGGWSVGMAREVLNLWKWEMIDYMPRNKIRTFHALSSDDYYLMEKPV